MRGLHRMAWIVAAAVLVCPPHAAAAKEKTQPAPQAAPKAVSNKDQQIKEAQARLNGTQWTVELMPMSGEKPKAGTKDTLIFDKGRIQSKQLAGSGFPATNYTLTVGDDGVAVWETMQTGQDTSVAFWRGELHGETMRGILSKHPAKGNSIDMAFSGQFSGAVEPGAGIPDPVAPDESKAETKAAEVKAEVKSESKAESKAEPAVESTKKKSTKDKKKSR